MTSLHIACYCSSVASCLQLLPKIPWYLETPPKQICMDKDQEEPSYFSIAAPPQTLLLSEAHHHFQDISCSMVPQEKNERPKRSVSPLLWEWKKPQSTAVSISISEITYSSRIALEPSCVPTEQWAKHASTHPEEVMNPALPSTRSQTAPTPTSASPSHEQATAETQGVGRHQGNYPTTLPHVFSARAGKHSISPPGSASMGFVCLAFFPCHKLTCKINSL